MIFQFEKFIIMLLILILISGFHFQDVTVSYSLAKLMHVFYLNTDQMANANPFTINSRRGASDEIHKLFNSYRSEKSLGKIDWNDTVYDICLNHSVY